METATAWGLAGAVDLVVAAYSNSFQAGLVFDNANVIAGDPRIREATAHNVGLIVSHGYWYGRETSGLYRPVTTLSYLVNYAIFGNGAQPAGYHWVNLALHRANVALVYALGMLIFDDAALALALAAIWGLHPLLTESVTNIVGRADLLAAFGVLTGLLCYVKSAAATGRRKAGWLAALVAAQTVGLFSKESAAVLPGIMLLYDLLWPKPQRGARAGLAMPRWRCHLRSSSYLRGGVHTQMIDGLRRESSGERGFLDGPPHGGEGDRQVPMAVSVAGAAVGRLFVQCDSVVRLEAPIGTMRSAILPVAGDPYSLRGRCARLPMAS